MHRGEEGADIQAVLEDLEAIREKLSQVESRVALLKQNPDQGSLRLDDVNRIARQLSECTGQEELLSTLLEQLRPFAERSALFLRSETGYQAWKSNGFAANMGEGPSLSDQDHPVIDASRKLRVVKVKDPEWFPSMTAEGRSPENAFCIPIAFGTEVPLVLYVDSARQLSIDSLRLITQLAALVLKNLYLASLVQSDRQTPDKIEDASVPVTEAKGAPARVTPEPSSEEDQVSSRIPVGEETRPIQATESTDRVEIGAEEAVSWDEGRVRETEPESTSAFDYEEPPILTSEQGEEAAGDAHGDHGDWIRESAPILEDRPEDRPSASGTEAGTKQDVVAGLEPTPEPERFEIDEGPNEEQRSGAAFEAGTSFARPEELAEPVQEEVQEREDHAERRAEATPGAEGVIVPDEVKEVPNEEFEARKTDAHRFARLLVSEIKLYNEEGVEQGRRNRDLYVRLQRDIDRSREMYEKRVHPSIKATSDYFHEELVRILGQEDAETLGDRYPGPSSGS